MVPHRLVLCRRDRMTRYWHFVWVCIQSVTLFISSSVSCRDSAIFASRIPKTSGYSAGAVKYRHPGSSICRRNPTNPFTLCHMIVIGSSLASHSFASSLSSIFHNSLSVEVACFVKLTFTNGPSYVSDSWSCLLSVSARGGKFRSIKSITSLSDVFKVLPSMAWGMLPSFGRCDNRSVACIQLTLLNTEGS